MHYASRPVTSNQQGMHPKLEGVVRRHTENPWLKPPGTASRTAFEGVRGLMAEANDRGALVFDAGCGTGRSTRKLALELPGFLVIGIDRSLKRLSRTGHLHFPAREGNIVWVRADLPSFWTLAAREGWILHRHRILYPNPYPKASQLRRRWHGHPVFPMLLRLGGELEVRSNWLVYIEEFARSVELLTGFRPAVKRVEVPDSMSRFEEKYHRSGHELFGVRVPASVLDNERRNKLFATQFENH